jgi:regulator of nonsense transcripts 2
VTPKELDSEEEHIVVTRPEEQLDPEAEADFDREFEKMMAESLDSRKFERKSMFDVPLPMRKVQRDKTEAVDDDEETAEVEAAPLNTMAFSLMTKRGNRQQVRHVFSLTEQLRCSKGSSVCLY